MDKLDMLQFRFGKIDQFGWWDLERISADAGTQFTSTEFKDECQTCRVLQYTRYPSTARGSSLAVNYRTLDVRVTSDRPSTP